MNLFYGILSHIFYQIYGVDTLNMQIMRVLHILGAKNPHCWGSFVDMCGGNKLLSRTHAPSIAHFMFLRKFYPHPTPPSPIKSQRSPLLTRVLAQGGPL